MSREVPAVNKRTARTAADIFGGPMQVTRFSYDFTDQAVDILASPDSPCAGITSYATVSLSDYPLMRDGKAFSARLEMVGACATSTPLYANMLSSAAAGVHHHEVFCTPGLIFADVVSEYIDDSPMEHVMFVPPYLWNRPFETPELEGRTVAWLQMVPISDAEMTLARTRGSDELLKRLEAADVDVCNIRRRSVVT